ncbi:MAG: hypothetical protein M1812_007521 [Candelaria pacifica]|nr:MAG: hypothetical protein M1812_007521 [Candelaria pacifica]
MSTSNATSKPLINLLRGWPSPSLLPTTALSTASQTALQTPSISTPNLLYGDFAGPPPLRAAIAQWLNAFYTPSTPTHSQNISPITPERICVTGGASQNIACVLQVYSDALYTRNIWMVAPTYFLACRIFEDAGFAGKMRAVPEDEEGIDIGFLRQELEKSEQKALAQGNIKATLKPSRPNSKIYRHLIYAVPTFSNPSSKTMSLQRRQQLVHLAREYDALILTDDVYDMLQWSSSPSSSPILDKALQPRIVGVDRELGNGTDREGADGFGNAMSNGSFSKIVAPGVRTGWAESTPKFIKGLSMTGSTASGGCPSTLTSTLIHQLLTTNMLNTHIHKILLPTYASRYQALLSAINTHLLPHGITLPHPPPSIVGGYFIWLSLPSELSATDVVSRCKEDENLIVSPGTGFEVAGDEDAARFEGFIRLCWAWEAEEEIVEGVRRLGRVVESMIK